MVLASESSTFSHRPLCDPRRPYLGDRGERHPFFSSPVLGTLGPLYWRLLIGGDERIKLGCRPQCDWSRVDQALILALGEGESNQVNRRGRVVK